jgi:hypothetical protein
MEVSRLIAQIAGRDLRKQLNGVTASVGSSGATP